jgi:hypothetical protein
MYVLAVSHPFLTAARRREIKAQLTKPITKTQNHHEHITSNQHQRSIIRVKLPTRISLLVIVKSLQFYNSSYLNRMPHNRSSPAYITHPYSSIFEQLPRVYSTAWQSTHPPRAICQPPPAPPSNLIPASRHQKSLSLPSFFQRLSPHRPEPSAAPYPKSSVLPSCFQHPAPQQLPSRLPLPSPACHLKYSTFASSHPPPSAPVQSGKRNIPLQ